MVTVHTPKVLQAGNGRGKKNRKENRKEKQVRR